MGKKGIKAKDVPEPNRLFSRGIVIENPKKMIFLSGICSQAEGIREQTMEVFKHIQSLLEAAGASWGDVVRCLFFLKDMKRDFEEFDRARKEFFEKAGIGQPYPTSTGVQATMVNERYLIEMEVMAVIS